MPEAARAGLRLGHHGCQGQALSWVSTPGSRSHHARSGSQHLSAEGRGSSLQGCSFAPGPGWGHGCTPTTKDSWEVWRHWAPSPPGPPALRGDSEKGRPSMGGEPSSVGAEGDAPHSSSHWELLRWAPAPGSFTHTRDKKQRTVRGGSQPRVSGDPTAKVITEFGAGGLRSHKMHSTAGWRAAWSWGGAAAWAGDRALLGGCLALRRSPRRSCPRSRPPGSPGAAGSDRSGLPGRNVTN